MNRRTTKITGCVNFPVNDPIYENTGEGGIFVKLLIIDKNRNRRRKEWAQCCGAYVHDLFVEILISDNLLSKRSPEQLQKYHYPLKMGDGDLSGRLIGVIVLGSTGWTGYHQKTGNLWKCAESDLNEDGQNLMGWLSNIYPEAEFHLLTFLDT